MSNNMPQYPMHPNCDCLMFAIAKPVTQATSYCPNEKFTDYLFSDEYSHNGKIKIFHELGFTIADSEYLKSELEKQALFEYLSGDYTLGKLNRYGQRITISIELKSPTKDNIVIKTGWMLRPLGRITCNTPYGAR